MNKILITAVLLVLIGCQQTGISVCECTDLKSEADCNGNKLSKQCSWDSTAKTCSVSSNPQTTTETKSLYCSPIKESDCAKTDGCAWVNKKCTHFTGCSSFKLTTDEECKQISNKCITDGIHCVELDKCYTYKKEKSCLGSTLKPLCIWDVTNSSCADADTCEKLAKSLTTDEQCRNQITSCTTTGAGCVTSGTTCTDQTSEISCFWDLNKQKSCFWNKESSDEKKCKEKICDNAPLSYTTHLACQGFLENLTCTAKKAGGCKTISTCEQNLIKEGCVINNQGKQCYWSVDTTNNTSTCVVLECKAAPKSIITNDNCKTFAPGMNCITQNGGGCVTNSTCSAANIEAACKTNIQNVTCFWDTSVTPNICKELICSNLPQTITTAAECSSKISTCTLNTLTSKGCVQKTCQNAPNDTTDCELYYPGNKCIKNKNGGCNQLTTCSSITLDTLCIQNINGSKCFWNNNLCIDLTCDNLPTTLLTHQECKDKLNTCTNKEGGGCQTQTCENSKSNDICSTTSCKWKGDMCFEKTCSLANFTNHQECNTYLDSCTFNLNSNATIGCALIPLRCDAIFNIEACKKKKVIDSEGIISYKNCGWDGSKCVDVGCTTLSKTYTTTVECQINGLLFGNCVSANPVGSDPVAGCIVLPATCSDRKTSDNCEQRFNDVGVRCIWDVSSSPQKCIEKACTTASVIGTTGVVTNFTNDNCFNYLSTCIANNAENGCQAKGSSCSSLVSNNCLDNAKTNGHCVMKNGSCVDKTCDNLLFTNHEDCYNATNMNYSCTVNSTGTGCQVLKAKCTDYSPNGQCVETISGDSCKIADGKCVSPSCSDADKTDEFNTHDKCNAFMSTCTILPIVGTCQKKATNCSDYLIEDNCLFLLNGDRCLWGGKACYLESAFQCSNAYIQGEYTTGACEYFSYECKANETSTGCITKICTDYWTDDGYSDGYRVDSALSCYNLNSTCTLNNNISEFACQTNQATCNLYQIVTECSTATEGECFWNSVSNKCVKKGFICSDYQGPTTAICEGYMIDCKASGSTNTSPCQDKVCSDYVKRVSALTRTDCQGISFFCTVDSAGNACQDVSSCSGYTSQTACSYDTLNYKCFWDTNTCISLSGPTCTKVTGQTGLTRANCRQYSTTCTVNRGGTACIEIKNTCAGLDIGDCQENQNKYCVQNQADDSGATCADPTTDQTCNTIYFQSGKYTHDKCSNVNSNCTVNSTNTACENHTCSNAPAFTTCNMWLSTCISNGSGGCIIKQDSCSGYISPLCFTATEGDCVDNSGTCIKLVKTCANATTKTSYASCQSWLSTCTYNGSGACVTISATCGEQSSTACYRSTAGACMVSGSSCVDYALKCSDAGLNYSFEECQAFSSSCTYDNFGTCAPLKQTCTEQTTSECYQAVEGPCEVSGSNCILLVKTCSNAPEKTSFSSCNHWLNTCTWNGTNGCTTIAATCGGQTSTTCYQSSAGQCMVSGANCVNYARTCSNASEMISHYECEEWLSSCYWDGVAGCLSQQNLCTSYSTSNCYKALEGRCVVYNSTCVKFTECTQIQNPEAHDECQMFSTECTIAPRGGCFPITTCAAFKNSSQCKRSLTTDCFWNATNQTCVDYTCNNIEQSNLYNTHSKCYELTNFNSIPLKCTIRNDLNNTGPVNGCKDLLDQCSAYKIQEQCKVTKSATQCDWQSNETSGVCVNRQCSTASTSNYNSHLSCLNYLSHVKCTVGIKITETSYELAGCISLSACSSYNYQEQCMISDNNDICDWNGTKCDIKSCLTANPENYKTHDDCQNYFNQKCTVSDTDSGCIELPISCEELNTINNCQFNRKYIKCYWNADTNKCVTPTCQNAPTTFITTSTCSDYLNICTQDNEIPCKTLICEDFTEITDEICKTKMPINYCTTDGSKCIQRGTCKQAQAELSCTFDVASKLCQWNKQDGYCTDMNCSTAPTDKFTTDALCAQYYIPKKCMLKTGGGCTNRLTCPNIKEQSACTNTIGDVNGTICSWDNGNCRFQNCTDFTGNTHEICQALFQKGICTAGLNSKCAPVDKCINTKVQAACVLGLDGPCLWIDGSCYLYSRCESVSFTSDYQCKIISSNCSIDTVKNQCVPITSCLESNINGGCVTGYDGECIMSQDTNGKICRIKNNCTDAALLTFDECQQANQGCTTDGTKGCIDLSDCSSYVSEAGCVRNKSGPTQSVTGICIWDSTLKSCHDQLCSEITEGNITSHYGCSSILPKCSSNGTKCVEQTTCDKYEITDIACNSAKGTDQLPCFYEAPSEKNKNIASCRTKKCSDIININECQTSGLLCVSDGTKCIDKGVCSSYTTKIACNSGGTNGDGVCIFKATNGTTGTCTKMTSCVSASSDQDACENLQMKSFCSWTPINGTQASTCKSHSCSTFAQFNSGICASFKVYGGATQQICSVVNSICKETDPSSLNQDQCFGNSNYVYTWNQSTNKCQQCKGSTANTNNTLNNTNINTDKGQILGLLSTIIVGIVFF